MDYSQLSEAVIRHINLQTGCGMSIHNFEHLKENLYMPLSFAVYWENLYICFWRFE
jgi:hypothetical protein